MSEIEIRLIMLYIIDEAHRQEVVYNNLSELLLQHPNGLNFEISYLGNRATAFKAEITHLFVVRIDDPNGLIVMSLNFDVADSIFNDILMILRG